METGQDSTQLLAILSLVIGGGGGLYVLIKAVIDKFGKGPVERQNEVAFDVGILEKQIQRSVEESKRWHEVEQYLREEIRRANSDTERVQSLLDTARQQIVELQAERNELRERYRLLAAKFTRGERITLADITGDTSLEVHLGTEVEAMDRDYLSSN